MIQIYDVEKYDFSIIVKIVRKGADFYYFNLTANIERRVANNLRFILRLYTYLTNVHRWQKYKSCSQSRTILPNLKTFEKFDFFGHKRLKIV